MSASQDGVPSFELIFIKCLNAEFLTKVRVKLSLFLTKYYAMTMYPLLH
jgi:hypothetical protein